VTWVLVAAVFLAGCFISPVIPIGGGKSSKQVQRETATKLTPPALGVEDDYKGAVRMVRIRVYADDDHRAQNLRWQQTFAELLAHANEILAAQFGVRLDAEYRSWSYRAPVGETLDTILRALATEDPGSDVFAVVALTSALSLVSTTFEQLGVATTPGKHMVMRGFADRGERELFDRAFKDLDAKQRDTLHASRRKHKTVAVFLHELGHNLGAHHRGEPHTLMSPQYSHQASSFDATSRDVIQRTLDVRLGRPTQVPAQKPEAHPTLVVIVDEQGNRIVGGQAVDYATLDGLLQLHHTDDPNTEVLIRARDKAPQNVVLEVMKRAKAAGLSRISIGRD
jgi:biopolymer transport protein ExbD